MNFIHKTGMTVMLALGSVAHAKPADVWLSTRHGIDYGLPTQVWVHRPSQTSLIRMQENYRPHLTSGIRLRAYCKGLQQHFTSIQDKALTDRSCVFSGLIGSKAAVEGASLSGRESVYHFAGEVKRDPAAVFRDLSTLARETAVLK
jgi:hypothetical protein